MSNVYVNVTTKFSNIVVEGGQVKKKQLRLLKMTSGTNLI